MDTIVGEALAYKENSSKLKIIVKRYMICVRINPFWLFLRLVNSSIVFIRKRP